MAALRRGDESAHPALSLVGAARHRRIHVCQPKPAAPARPSADRHVLAAARVLLPRLRGARRRPSRREGVSRPHHRLRGTARGGGRPAERHRILAHRAQPVRARHRQHPARPEHGADRLGPRLARVRRAPGATSVDGLVDRDGPLLLPEHGGDHVPLPAGHHRGGRSRGSGGEERHHPERHQDPRVRRGLRAAASGVG